jgi:hypothetical protein
MKSTLLAGICRMIWLQAPCMIVFNMPTDTSLREKAGYDRFEPLVIGTYNRLRPAAGLGVNRSRPESHESRSVLQ